MDPTQLAALLNQPAPTPTGDPDYLKLLGFTGLDVGTAPVQPQPIPSSPSPAPTPPLEPEPSLVGAPVTSPSQDPGESALATPARESSGASSSVGVGASVSGFDPAKFAAVQKAGNGLDARIARDTAAVQQSYEPLIQEQQGATDAAVAAVTEAGAAEAARAGRLGEIKTKIAGLHQDFAVKEQAAMDAARTQADAVFADYKAAQAQYAAMRPNSAQLWDAAGREGQFSMVVTAFAHDFLGARGIKTSGMESINRAIQNNINDQLTRMQQQQHVAQGFRDLWDMQRAQSASDAEARARMNGFYLQAVASELEGTLGAYDSRLAVAKAQAAKAQLLQEQAKNDMVIRQHIDATATARSGQQVQRYGQELQASIAREELNFRRSEADRKAKADAGKGESPLESLVFDVSKSGGKRAYRQFLPGMTADKKNEHRVQDAKVKQTVEAIDDLLSLQSQIDKTPPGDSNFIKKLQGEKARTAELVRDLVRTGIIYDNTGKAVNEQEFKIYNRMVSDKDWFLNGDNVRPLAKLALSLHDKQAKVMESISMAIPEDSPLRQISSGEDKSDPGLTTLNTIRSSDGSGRHIDTPVEIIDKEIKKPRGEVAPAGLAPEPGDALNAAKALGAYLESKPAAELPEEMQRAIGYLDANSPAWRASPTDKDAATVFSENPEFLNLYRLAKLADQPAAEGSKEARTQLEVYAEKTNSPYTPGFRGLTADEGRRASEAEFLLKLIDAN